MLLLADCSDQRRGWKMVGTWHNTIWVPGEELLVDLFILPDDK